MRHGKGETHRNDFDLALTAACCQQAWEHAPLQTLRLIAQLRDMRHGKGETQRGMDAFIWLAHRHPATLLANLQEIVKVLFDAHLHTGKVLRTQCCRPP